VSAVHVATDAFILGWREVVQFFRRPARLVSFFLQPLLFLGLFAFGIKATLRPQVDGYDYVLFVIPGLVGQRLVTTASRGGMGLIRDRHGGFLKEVLVAPVSRSAVLIGLSAGHVFRSVLQGIFLLLIGVSLGLAFGGGAFAPLNFVLCVLVMSAMGLAIVMLSMALAWRMDDAQNFMLFANYLTMPLFLLSGALYPLGRLPAWLAVPVKLNPLTYAVDASRSLALGPGAGHFPLYLDILVVVGFFFLALGLGLRVMRLPQAE
jgi:ABC-2 type transport system permease protein